MPPVPDRSSCVLPSSPSSSGRRIITRIASPFASKARHVTDFSIDLDEEHKQFSPGDVVTGRVNLRTAKALRITHLVVCLHGFVQVFKNPGSHGDGHRSNLGHLGTGRGKKSGEYFGHGFASLFEDEVVLSGDGRLTEGMYQFKFELEFPDRDLPSSIDFERGTISYMVTATLTRPTAISPTMTCDRKVYFVERIDISPLLPPAARTITLEPISKRSRAKNQARKLVEHSDRKSRRTDSTQHGSEQAHGSRASSNPSAHTESEVPSSPVPSDRSLDSALSLARTSQAESNRPDSSVASEAGNSKLNVNKMSLGNKVIVATVESQAGGCLRGDSISVKVNVSHTKQIKSLYGVIATLYRQARVDMHPAIPLGPTERGKGSKYEDYYPRSVTGLGGLSLSGAGSSHVFRKDLSQVMLPLMIDPHTLSAEVTAKLRVPDDSFPTISTVPGAMISFKYYVEVMIDVQGKLAGQDRRLGSLPGGPPGHTMIGEGPNTERPAFTPYGSTIIDTSAVRRDKGVVSCTFEVVVGTRDSERRKGKRKLQAVGLPELEQPQQSLTEHGELHYDRAAYDETGWYNPGGYHEDQWYQHHDPYHNSHGSPQTDQYDYSYYDGTYYEPPAPPVLMPRLPDESQMSDKERVQQAEARLLPSQPPGEDGEAEITDATAPYLPDGLDENTLPGLWASAPQYAPPAASSSMRSSNPAQRQNRGLGTSSNIPQYEPPHAGSSSQALASAGDDKQELQRRDLQAGASSPPGEDDEDEDEDGDEDDDEDEERDGDGDEGHDSAATGPDRGRAAATVGEVNGVSTHDSHADATGSAGLPRYER